MSNTSKNEQMNTTLKRAKLNSLDLVHIKNCMEDSIKSNPNSTLNKDYEKTLEKVNALIEVRTIELILASRIEEIKLMDIAMVLDIHGRKSNNIHGLDYYYGENSICAYVPKSNTIAYTWENAQDFMKSHNMSLVEDLKEYNPREYMK